MAVLGAVAFSGKAIIVKLAYRHGVDAVTLLCWRMLLAFPFFLAMAWWAGRGAEPLSRRDWLAVVGLGFCGYYLSSYLDFLGLQHISASLERLILYLNPMMVLVLSWLLWRKRVTLQHGLAMAVSYAGIALVFGREWGLAPTQASGRVFTGAAWVFASAASYAVYLVFSGRWVQRLGAMRLTGMASSVACVLCVVQFVSLRPLEALAVPQPVLWLSLLNATACTALPVLATMMAVQRLGAPQVSQVGMIGPMATLVMGAALLGEPITLWVVVGTALVLAGVMLLARAKPA